MRAKIERKLVTAIIVHHVLVLISLFVFGAWFGKHPEALFFITLYCMFGPVFML